MSTPSQKLWQLQIFLDAAGLHEQSKLAFAAIQQLAANVEQQPDHSAQFAESVIELLNMLEDDFDALQLNDSSMPLSRKKWNEVSRQADLIRNAQPLDTVQGDAQAVAWRYCPECGSEEIRHQEGEHKQCAKCHQEWFSSIDYSDVVQGNLIRLHTSVGETAELRRRIATADQLLRDYYGDAHLCAFKAKDINAFLSASAKPEGGEE